MLERSATVVNNLILEDNLTYRGVTVLHYRINYPEFSSEKYPRSTKSISNYYSRIARQFQRFIETEIYRMAVEEYRNAVENGYPVRVFDVVQSYEVTYNVSCIISLYFDRYVYTGGAHGVTGRTSHTWDLQRNRQITLEELFKCDTDMKEYLMECIERQISREPDIYFEDYRERISQYFREENFYCELSGVVIYYQQYDIAPYSSGIRTFLIPYNCFTDPSMLCVNVVR